MNVKNYTDWEKVLLDTSVVIGLLRSTIDDKVPVCNFIAKLLGDLSQKKSAAQKNRTFYISAISLSELLNKVNNVSNMERIVKALQSDNVEFRPFDAYVAEFLVKNYYSHLGKEKLTDFARELSWPEHHLAIGRQWIEKDLMLIATADALGCDTIITLDKNTMLPLAERVDYFCSLAYQEQFQFSSNGKNIFNYDRPKTAQKEKGKKQG